MEYIPFVFSGGTTQNVDTPGAPEFARPRPWVKNEPGHCPPSVATSADGAAELSSERRVHYQADSVTCRNVAIVAGAAAQIDVFCERSAVAEFEGGLPRAHAEVLAALATCNLGRDGPRIIDLVARNLEILARYGALK
ncbi:hypothetical protein G3545_13785 [Starkeya sp. ORNL1]|uniref:hypothetical protein n=1 Tax=Starkeya sp. ORNL1 TaxID=2709380 RepID=UPI001463BD4D|nr:hypothetical protein [Starkeya sp. ORNL1]QJP14621.1 hypothetical protein G3545_13785 [Starkeya sp. ORNL1]